MSEEPTNPDNTRPTDPAPPETATIDARRPALMTLPDGFTSPAGVIDNLTHHGVTGTVSVLYCVAGSVRANHWHRTDAHWLYVVEGEVEYYERAVGSKDEPECQRFYEREMFYTPANMEHAMKFPNGAVLVSMSRLPRSHNEHELDVVRLAEPMVT